MRTEQSNRSMQATQLAKGGQEQMVPQPWVKPTFALVPLNDALSPPKAGVGTDQGTYSS